MVKRLVTTRSGSVYLFKNEYGVRINRREAIEGLYLGDFEIGKSMRVWTVINGDVSEAVDTSAIISVEVLD